MKIIRKTTRTATPLWRTASLFLVVTLLVFSLNPRAPYMQPVVDASQGAAVEWGANDDFRLNIMSYNVFVRPEPVSFGDETACRSSRIGEWLSEQPDLDVAVLTETFFDDDVELITRNAATKFPHKIVGVPDSTGLLGVSGGLTILSRFPIEKWEAEPFETCAGAFSDCLAAKGIVWAVLRLDKIRRVNVVATHLDAGRGAADVAARAAQLQQARDFLDERVDNGWPTVFMGDFNVDGLEADPDSEYDTLLNSLRGAMGSQRVVDTVRAVSERVEKLARQALDTLNCDMTIWCDGAERSDEKHRRLDYIFAYDSKKYRADVISATHDPVEDDTCGSRYLSDHKAVRATVSFHL